MKTRLALLPLAFLLACGGSSSAAKPTTLDIAKLGLKADVPEGSAAGDAIVGDGVLIQGPGLVIDIAAASDSTPKTIEDAKSEAEMYSPKDLKEEKLADGFALSFVNEGGMGTNYWVQVRREIDGKAYWCTTTASQPEQQANALAACKSLKK